MDAIDRITPTKRPAGAPQGYQRWRSLLFLHWEVPLAVLRPLVPDALALDTCEDRAYVGLVPFTMQGVRPLRQLPALPGTADFHETNVRTYVHHRGAPGVYFFSLDAANRLAVWAARTFFHLPYFHAAMTLTRQGDEVRYTSARRRGSADLSLRYRIGAPLPPSEPGTLQFFLAERYLLFTQDKKGQVLCGQVHHAPYPLRAAEVLALDQGLLAAAGLPTTGAQAPALYSPGVDVEIFPLRPHLPRAPR